MNGMKRTRFVKKEKQSIDIGRLMEGVLSGDRSMLAKAITLIESNAPHHFELAQSLLTQALPHTGKSVRIGISGVPGAGKSTFIESLGTFLCRQGHKVAVLAIDPSSTVHGGSILGDKTRMEKLSADRNAFIRPSPSEGTLGGVHRKTRESMLLCEAAGYDVILIETVGVGQSEAIVRDMADLFMLLVLTGAGDELQGMKKGIMELTDLIVVNKADGENKTKAMATRQEYNRFLHMLQPATPGWTTEAYTCSSIENDGVSEVWGVIEEFVKHVKQTGIFQDRRKMQTKKWMKDSLTHQLNLAFYRDEQVKERIPSLESEVMEGKMTVSAAVMEALEIFLGQKK